MHAGALETSVGLALFDALVADHDSVVGYTAAEPGWMERIWSDGIAALSSSGVLGDPAGANCGGGSGDLRRARRRARGLDRPGIRYPPRALSRSGSARLLPIRVAVASPSPSSTQRAGGTVRTGVIGTMVAALAFFDGVVLGAPVAIARGLVQAADRLRGRHDCGHRPHHRLLSLGRPAMGRLAFREHQPHRKETRQQCGRAD